MWEGFEKKKISKNVRGKSIRRERRNQGGFNDGGSGRSHDQEGLLKLRVRDYQKGYRINNRRGTNPSR